MIRKRFFREPLILSDSEDAGFPGKEVHPPPRSGQEFGGRKDQLTIGKDYSVLRLIFFRFTFISSNFIYRFPLLPDVSIGQEE